MKKYLFALIFSFSIPLMAISPPKPIEGTPFILSPSFSASSGPFMYSIDLPSKWGIGDTSVSKDGSGSFVLYPKQGGHGCSIDIKLFDTPDLAQKKLANLRGQFKSTKDLDDGFEVELSKAWFSCRVQGSQLIQTWYSLPKKTKEHGKNWSQLKQCVSISNAEEGVDTLSYTPGLLPPPALSPTPMPTYQPFPMPSMEWVFEHPTKPLAVFFEKHGARGTVPEKGTKLYLLEFSDAKAFGYLYVEWDQTALDTQAPYQKHLDKIAQDIKGIEPQQNFEEAQFDLEQGYAILPGHPYGIITFQGNGFLIGIGVKDNFRGVPYDIMDIIKKIKWTN